MEIYVKNTISLPVTNENGSYEIRLESIGGLGANLCGKMLGELGALSLSLNSLSFSSYGSEKRGSPVKAYVRWCADDRPLRVNSPVTRPHLLGIFHEGLIGTYPVLDGVTVDTKSVLFPSENSIVWMPSHLRWKVIPASTWSCSVLWCAPAALSHGKQPKCSAAIRSGKNTPH